MANIPRLGTDDDDDDETCPICGKPAHKVGERCSYADIIARTDRDSE